MVLPSGGRTVSTLTATEFLTTVDWGAISKRLLAYALRRLARCSRALATEENAMEIVHDAIVHLLDDEHRDWCPDAPPSEASLLLHLGSEINGIIVNRHRKRLRRPPEVTADERLGVASNGADPASSLEAGSLLARAKEVLRPHPDARTLLGLFQEGCTEPADQAQTLQWPIRRVYKARERMRAKLQELS